jgi:hypothetical protein
VFELVVLGVVCGAFCSAFFKHASVATLVATLASCAVYFGIPLLLEGHLGKWALFAVPVSAVLLLLTIAFTVLALRLAVNLRSR